MRPSRRKTWRWACAPIAASCVTITTVLPSTCTERSSARISPPVCESRLPVGSSASSEAGAVHERARDRDALALASRDLRRQVARACAEADPRERRERALAPLAPGDAAIRERQLDVLDHREPRQQVEALEHEADLARRAAGRGRRRRSRRRRARSSGSARWSDARGSRGSPSAWSCRSPTGP